MKTKFKLTPLERNWILYDVGNSAFILLVTTLVPIFFNALASGAGVSEDLYLSYWGYAGSIATLLVALIGPVCGTLADQKGYKKPIFLLCCIIGILGCAVMGFAGHWLAFLGIFVIARVGYNSSLVFYDAMLPEVTTEERMDSVSSMGYAFGYIGSVIPFILCLMLVLFSDAFGISVGTAMILAFLITAVWWGACTLPLLKTYQQRAYVPRKEHVITDTFKTLANTVKMAKKEKHIFVYMLSFFFFIDGVYTIIDMATAYGAALGLDTTGLLLALLLTQFVAFPFSILFGRLSIKYDSAVLIKTCILSYTGITLFATFLVAQWQFWMLAVLVGMFQGGIQALSRSYLGKIIPPEHSGEYYGLLDICGKGASFLGLLLISAVSQATAGLRPVVFGIQLQNENIAVGSLVVIFAIGYVLFCKADKLNKARKESI